MLKEGRRGVWSLSKVPSPTTVTMVVVYLLDLEALGYSCAIHVAICSATSRPSKPVLCVYRGGRARSGAVPALGFR